MRVCEQQAAYVHCRRIQLSSMRNDPGGSAFSVNARGCSHPFGHRRTRYGSSKSRKSCSFSASSTQACTPGSSTTRCM